MRDRTTRPGRPHIRVRWLTANVVSFSLVVVSAFDSSEVEQNLLSTAMAAEQQAQADKEARYDTRPVRGT